MAARISAQASGSQFQTPTLAHSGSALSALAFCQERALTNPPPLCYYHPSKTRADVAERYTRLSQKQVPQGL